MLDARLSGNEMPVPEVNAGRVARGDDADKSDAYAWIAMCLARPYDTPRLEFGID